MLDVNEWTEYTIQHIEDYIPMDKWGKDHWSTLAYLETRAVDHNGVIDNRHMRCDSRLHRVFAHGASLGRTYPTRLDDGSEIFDHDDWSCVEDMAALGLLTVEWKKVENKAYGSGVARVKFTNMGILMAHTLRAHKMDGGTFSTFNSFLRHIKVRESEEGNL